MVRTGQKPGNFSSWTVETVSPLLELSQTRRPPPARAAGTGHASRRPSSSLQFAESAARAKSAATTCGKCRRSSHSPFPPYFDPKLPHTVWHSSIYLSPRPAVIQYSIWLIKSDVWWFNSDTFIFHINSFTYFSHFNFWHIFSPISTSSSQIVIKISWRPSRIYIRNFLTVLRSRRNWLYFVEMYLIVQFHQTKQIPRILGRQRTGKM